MSYTKAAQRKYDFILGATRLEKRRALQRIHLGQHVNIPGECRSCNDHIVYLQGTHHDHDTHTHTHIIDGHAHSQNHYHHRNLNNNYRTSHGASLQNCHYHQTGCAKCNLHDYQRCNYDFSYDKDPYYPHKHEHIHGHAHGHTHGNDHGHTHGHVHAHHTDHIHGHGHIHSHDSDHDSEHDSNHHHYHGNDHYNHVHTNDHTHDHVHTLPEHSHHIITEDHQNNFRVGTNSLKNVTSGGSNTIIGINAGDSITSGSENVVIGKNADISSPDSHNEIVIGTDTTGVHSNVAVVGNEEITKLYAGSDGGATIFAYEHIQGSDSRIKENVKDLGKCLPFINSLRPVLYEKVKPVNYPDELKNKIYPNNKPRTMTDEEKNRSNLGFIAQEVEVSKNNNLDQPIDNMVNVNLDTGLYTLSYDKFVVPLVKAIQELKQETDNKINVLSKRIKK